MLGLTPQAIWRAANRGRIEVATEFAVHGLRQQTFRREDVVTYGASRANKGGTRAKPQPPPPVEHWPMDAGTAIRRGRNVRLQRCRACGWQGERDVFPGHVAAAAR